MVSNPADSNAQLDAATTLLAGELTANVDGANSNIRGWVATLRNASNGAFNEIADELTSLLSAINSGDNAQINASLRKLGYLTTDAASKAQGDTADKLAHLAESLVLAAGQLK